jgi:Tfp pilus assembly protein FimT
MKLPCHIPRARRQAGILLMECLVYISIFAILLGIGTAAFYFCWDHTRAVVFVTNDIESALRAGERWRADVRNATGPIAVETANDGETVRIPEAGKEILYRFHDGEIRRQTASSDFSELLLPKVKSSVVKADTRGQINAWRWELEVTPRRKETVMPLLFTFEAVQPHS